MDISLWWLWFVAGVLLIVGEMFTVSFYLLWLGIAAMVAAVLAYFFPEEYWLPPLAASITGVLLIVFTKPLTARARQAKGYHDPAFSMANRQGEVVEPVTPTRLGIVKVGNEMWSASAQETLQPGQLVIVISQSSTVLQVQPLVENTQDRPQQESVW
ncbi:NfeD family protein [Nibribacter ruber]|uniref:NfeD family protein n=1 Tax=Nibribacter ruber TaxID=2698458 RepID=A0A6P1NZ17_9BACT|nr:NfeD family protein [Nibribacter ruber]QHL87218.1 NfeD family protein [Nibribacter ruber]